MAENNIKIYTIKVDTKSGEVKINGITKSFKEAEIALNKLNQQSQATTKTGLNPLTGATGLAGAAVTELGRTVSDLNYGFPAVANNISQLGSLFTILTVKAGGAKGAFQLMLKEIRGPLGILLAFQVVITLVESISKGLIKVGKGADTLTKAFKDAGKGVADISGNFEIYINTLQDSNKSQEEQEEAIKRLNKEFPDFVKSLDDSNLSMQDVKNSTKEATEQIELQRTAIINLAKSRAAQKRIEELSTEIIDKQVEQRKESIALGVEELTSDQLRRKASNISMDEFSQADDAEKIRRLNNLAGLKEENKLFIKNKREEIKLLTDYIEFEDDSRKKGTKSKKDFVARELLFDNDILKSKQNVKKQTIHGKEQQLRAESQYQMDLAQLKFKEFKRKQQERVDAIKEDEDRIKAQKKVDEAIKESQNSLSKFKLQKMQETNDLIDIERINDLQKAKLRQSDFMAKEQEDIASFDMQMSETKLGKVMQEIELEKLRHNNKIQNIRDEIEARELEGKSTVDLEEKKSNEIAKIGRINTKLKKKEEDAKLEIVNFAANAAIQIAGEGSAVGKAIGVAMAIINTKKAITEALGDSEVPGPFRILHAAAIGAFGFKQVKDIMAVKLPVAAASKDGAGGGSMSVSAPSFNVVGAGGTSQIAEAVTGAQGRPMRAYVVSTEVSSAQELDRKTVSESSLG